MKTYFRLMHDRMTFTSWHLDVVLSQEQHYITTVKFTQGKPLDLLNYEGLVVVCKQYIKSIDYTHTTYDIPIVSEEFSNFIAEVAPGSVQLLPVTILYENQEINSFRIMNIIKKIACLDLINSGISYASFPRKNSDQINAVYRIELLTEKVNNEDIFRLDEWDTAIILSDVLKQQIEHKKFSGLRFKNIG